MGVHHASSRGRNQWVSWAAACVMRSPTASLAVCFTSALSAVLLTACVLLLSPVSDHIPSSAAADPARAGDDWLH